MEKNELLTTVSAQKSTYTLRALYEKLASVAFFMPTWQGALQILRFLISGILATATHLGLTYALTEWAGVYYVLSSAIGFLFGFGVSFTLQKVWTFENKDAKQAQKQLAQHLLLQSCMLGVNSGGVYILTEWAKLHYMLAQFFVIACIATCSFFIYKFIIFAHASDARANA